MYARHNAVDIPALLPDGTMSDISVPAPLQTRGSMRGANAVAEREVEELAEGDASAGGRRRPGGGGVAMSTTAYLVLSAVLFTLGAVGVLVRRNAIVVFMCVEMMLNASNLAFVAFARQHGNLDGQTVAFFVMVVAAAEVVVGLAIIMTIFRTRRSASVDEASLLKY